MALGHLGAKRVGNVAFNLGAGRVRQVAGDVVGDELKLGPHNEMDDARVEAVRPVVVQHLVVVGKLKRPAAGPHGGRPAQTLVEDKVGNGAVALRGAIGELLVAAQLRGHALEALKVVGSDDAGDVGPGKDLVGRVGRGHAHEVLGVEAAQELGALGAAVPLGNVDVPKGNNIKRAHGRW